MSRQRKIIKSLVEPQLSTKEGEVMWQRSISLPGMAYLDPILMFDHFQRTDDFKQFFEKTQKKYLGMQMLTYMIGGKYHYRSAKRDRGSLGSASLLWVKSAAGVELEEVYELDQNLLEGFQIWVNLPAKNKDDTPEFKQVDFSEVPIVRQNDGVMVRVLSGMYRQTMGALDLTAPAVNLFDVMVPPYASFSLDAKYASSMVYLYQGRGFFGKYGEEDDVLVSRKKLMIYGEGDFILIRTEETPVRLLFLDAEAIQEPVARYGSFVLNDPDEINRYFSK